MTVGIICDFVEENWPSMDLVAEMLVQHLDLDEVQPSRIRPHLPRRFGRLPLLGKTKFCRNADRLAGRFGTYPRAVRRVRAACDAFHIVDHTYAHLVRSLPPDRTAVTCHDLDAFRPLFAPCKTVRGRLMRNMAERIADGFGRARRVACVSEFTRQELLRTRLISAERIVVVPNGVHPSCSPCPAPAWDRAAGQMLEDGCIHLLHVGSTAPRKRIDVLLRVLAAVAKEIPAVRLVRVGGPFPAAQQQLALDLDVYDRITVLPNLDRQLLAAVYRRSALLLLTSEREGFGLPVVESLASGTPVVASDLPVLREVGGPAAAYCRMGVVDAWTETVVRLLRDRTAWESRRAAGIAWAARFSWQEHARQMTMLYRELVS